MELLWGVEKEDSEIYTDGIAAGLSFPDTDLLVQAVFKPPALHCNHLKDLGLVDDEGCATDRGRKVFVALGRQVQSFLDLEHDSGEEEPSWLPSPDLPAEALKAAEPKTPVPRRIRWLASILSPKEAALLSTSIWQGGVTDNDTLLHYGLVGASKEEGGWATVTGLAVYRYLAEGKELYDL